MKKILAELDQVEERLMQLTTSPIEGCDACIKTPYPGKVIPSNKDGECERCGYNLHAKGFNMSKDETLVERLKAVSKGSVPYGAEDAFDLLAEAADRVEELERKLVTERITNTAERLIDLLERMDIEEPERFMKPDDS